MDMEEIKGLSRSFADSPRFFRGTITAVVCLLFGCSALVSVRAAHNEAGQDAVRERASFDFECPSDQLTLMSLESESEFPTQYGVTGCGRRSVYVHLPSSGWPGTWVLDSNSNPASNNSE